MNLERFEKIRIETKKNAKKSCVVPAVLALVILLIIFTKVRDNQAGERTGFKLCLKNAEAIISASEISHFSLSEYCKKFLSVLEVSKQNSRKVEESSPTPDGLVADGSDIRTVTFDPEHAIAVGESIHLSKNGDLEWQGKIVHHKGGTLGAYVEAVNIFNETDYHIYEVYDVLVNAHPELRTDHLEPYECEDINDYYGFTVTRVPAEINEIDKALREGCLVQLQVHSNKWRNAEGEQVDWPGYHSGLIFYFDGSLYHMKAAGRIDQRNAVYTREQLIDWIGGTSKRLVIYTKNQPE